MLAMAVVEYQSRWWWNDQPQLLETARSWNMFFFFLVMSDSAWACLAGESLECAGKIAWTTNLLRVDRRGPACQIVRQQGAQSGSQVRWNNGRREARKPPRLCDRLVCGAVYRQTLSPPKHRLGHTTLIYRLNQETTNHRRPNHHYIHHVCRDIPPIPAYVD